MFGSLDPAKLLVILVLALVILGPERLPRAARQLGAAWRQLSQLREQVSEEVRSAMPDLDLPRVPRNPGQAISGFLRDLTNSPTARVEVEPEPDFGVEDEQSPQLVVEAFSLSVAPESSASVAPVHEPAPGAPLAARSRPAGLPSLVLDPDDPGMN